MGEWSEMPSQRGPLKVSVTLTLTQALGAAPPRPHGGIGDIFPCRSKGSTGHGKNSMCKGHEAQSPPPLRMAQVESCL